MSMSPRDTIMPYNGTVDYSFKGLRTVAEMANEVPRATDPLGVAAALKNKEHADSPGELQGHGGSPPRIGQGSPRRMRFEKHIIGLRLDNNLFEATPNFAHELMSLPKSPIPDPERSLMWLDLSFNLLTHVDPSIAKLPNLKTLYLHGNKIGNLAQIEKLKDLHHLHSITTNGNPFDAKKYYRMFMIGALPHIRSVDHTSVTKDEEARARRFYVNFVIQRERVREARKERAEMQANAAF